VFETQSCYIAQVGLEFAMYPRLASKLDPPASASTSYSAGTIDTHYHTWPEHFLLIQVTLWHSFVLSPLMAPYLSTLWGLPYCIWLLMSQNLKFCLSLSPLILSFIVDSASSQPGNAPTLGHLYLFSAWSTYFKNKTKQNPSLKITVACLIFSFLCSKVP
jgi:hypothetical protein